MPFLTESAVRARAVRIARSAERTAGRILLEATASVGQKFDVFLSHSSTEPEEILLGIKLFLEDDGLSVYVDKYSDPQLSPGKVSRETANILRSRMGDSKILLYVHSAHSSKSRWMPWELGYFDGLKGKVGVIPVTKNQEEDVQGRGISQSLSLRRDSQRVIVKAGVFLDFGIGQEICASGPMGWR